jgi:formate-dependent nitrite reductase membrane component NrfD
MYTEVELIRNNPGVDPTMHIWGWEVPVYLFLGGVTAGVMILSALLPMRIKAKDRSRWSRWMIFAAPVLISLGMGALFLDLAYKLHVFRFYTSFQITSPMSWGSWILLAIYPATVLLGLAELTKDETDRLAGWKPLATLRLGGLLRWARSLALGRLGSLRWANIILGVALGGYTGILLGTLGARAMWNSAMLGPLFLVSGFSTGAAFMMLFAVNHDEHQLLRRWDLAAIGLEVLLIALFIMGLITGGGEPGQRAVALLLGGKFTAPFWALVITMGLAVPFLVEMLESRKGFKPTRVAPALILIGGLALRWIIVSAGQV